MTDNTVQEIHTFSTFLEDLKSLEGSYTDFYSTDFVHSSSTSPVKLNYLLTTFKKLYEKLSPAEKEQNAIEIQRILDSVHKLQDDANKLLSQQVSQQGRLTQWWASTRRWIDNLHFNPQKVLEQIAQENHTYLEQSRRKLESMLQKDVRQLEKKETVEKLKKVLSPFKSYADLGKLKLCVNYIGIHSQTTIDYTCHVLDQFDWPSEDIKRESLQEVMRTVLICNKAIRISGSYTDEHKSFKTTEVVVDITKLIGPTGYTGMFEGRLHRDIIEAIGTILHEKERGLIKQLQDEVDQGKSPNKMGIRVKIDRSPDCRFPASTVSMLFPQLERLPGLISLDISKIDTEYGDRDVHLLVQMMHKCRHLRHIQVDVEAMPPMMKKWFIQMRDEILQEEQRQSILSPQELLVGD